MTTTKTIEGIVAYPVTPFDGDERVDPARLAQLVDRLVQSGVHAIAPLGSTGESAYLSDDEWDEVAATSVHAVAGRVPTVVGVADLTTAGAVRRAKAAASFGADAVMLLPVSYWKLSEREILAHFGAVADAIDIPIMAYNNPATSGIDMRPDFLVELRRSVDNVTMIKESSGDITRMQRIVQLTDGELPVFNGSNPLALQAFAAGAVGWCTAAPCLIPQQCLDLYDLVRAGKLDEARHTLAAILPLLEFILQGGLPTTIKAGLALDGFDAGRPRRPLLSLDDEGRGELDVRVRRARAGAA